MLVCLLLLLRWCQLAYHQAADVAKADNQTWLTSGSVLMRAHQEIALGVYGLAGPAPAACNDDANLALIVPGRLKFCGVRRIGHSPE
jgi:hypothetical protein